MSTFYRTQATYHLPLAHTHSLAGSLDKCIPSNLTQVAHQHTESPLQGMGHPAELMQEL